MKHVLSLIIFAGVAILATTQEAGAQEAQPGENGKPVCIERPFSFYTPAPPAYATPHAPRPQPWGMMPRLRPEEEWWDTPGRYNFATGTTDPWSVSPLWSPEAPWRNLSSIGTHGHPSPGGPDMSIGFGNYGRTF